MSIVSVTRIWSGETWSDEKDGSREYEEVYRVISDDPDEAAITVRSHGSIPALLSAYGDDAAAVCTGRVARRVDQSRLIWEVTARFEWRPSDAEEDQDPLDREPKIRWTSNAILLPAIKDRDGDAIVNSAGDYFDPPPESERHRWVANIQFNATSIPTNIRSYAGAVNNSAVVIDGEPVAAERAKIIGLDISEVQYWGESQTPYRSITLAIECRDEDDEGYDLEMLDQGYRIKDGTELKDILIEDEDGNRNRPSSPVLLDGSGDKLTDPSPTNAVFLTFDTSNLRDISIFPGVS